MTGRQEDPYPSWYRRFSDSDKLNFEGIKTFRSPGRGLRFRGASYNRVTCWFLTSTTTSLKPRSPKNP